MIMIISCVVYKGKWTKMDVCDQDSPTTAIISQKKKKKNLLPQLRDYITLVLCTSSPMRNLHLACIYHPRMPTPNESKNLKKNSNRCVWMGLGASKVQIQLKLQKILSKLFSKS